MSALPTISYVVKNHMCTGCGVCQDVCPNKAISFSLNKGLNSPLVKKNLCKNNEGCSKCYEVCPGKGIELNRLGENIFNNTNHDYFIGHYISCYSGYSLDYDIRYHSASGGLLSQFLIFLLDKKIISGAVVTGFSKNDQMQPYSYIATTRSEVLAAKSSKYCPVSLNGIASKIKKMEGEYVVVGLPCHIQGFRKMEVKDKLLKSKVFGYFSIFCSSTRNFYSQDYLCIKYSIDRNKLKYFTYRDDGCLGYMKALHIDDRLIKVGYRKYYHSLRSFFKPKRCLTCIDHYGDLADMCFGDIQVGEYKNDKTGVNSLVVRDKKFESLINEATKEKVLCVNKIPADIVNASQKVMLYHKRSLSKSVMFVDKLLFRKTPVYDVQLQGSISLKTLFSVIITHTQRFIGRNRRFWFIIDIFDKKN